MRQADPTNPNAILSLYAPNKHISATQMAGILRQAALRSMKWLHAYDFLRIGPHSLQASGAIQLKVNGVSDAMVQKMEGWTSTTWLQHLYMGKFRASREASPRKWQPLCCTSM